MEDKDPTADNNSGDEDLAAELARQEGGDSESDLDDPDSLARQQHENTRAHGYELDDFVVDDDQVDVDTEEEDSQHKEEEWEEWREPPPPPAHSEMSWLSCARRRRRRRRGRFLAFAPDIDEDEEEVFYSPENAFQRRPTGRRAPAPVPPAVSGRADAIVGRRLRRGTGNEGRGAPPASEVVGLEDDILPDELRQLQREAG